MRVKDIRGEFKAIWQLSVALARYNTGLWEPRPRQLMNVGAEPLNGCGVKLHSSNINSAINSIAIVRDGNQLPKPELRFV